MERCKGKNLKTVIALITILAMACTLLLPMEAYAASKPGQVKSLKASSKSYNSVKLSWKKAKGAKGYQVYRATSKNGRYKKVKTTKSTSYTNGKLTTGKRYYYKVRAYKGSRTGSYSSKKSAVPTLSKPSVKSSASTKTIKLTWGKISGAKGYQVYRKTSSKGKWSRIKTTSARSYSATIGENKTYYYRVRAYRKVGKSTKYSSYSSTKTTKTGVYKPSTPSLSASATGTTTAKTSWSKASNATGYQLYRAVAGGSYARILTTKSTSYTNSGLKSSTSYYYKVRAYRTVGNRTVYGNFTSARLIKTNAPPKPNVPDETKDCYLPYGSTKTKIWIGQDWTDTVNRSLNAAVGGAGAVNYTAVRNNVIYNANTYIYCFDTKDFSDFLMVYVTNGRVAGWLTTANNMGVIENTTIKSNGQQSVYENLGDPYGVGPFLAIAEFMISDPVYDKNGMVFAGIVDNEAAIGTRLKAIRGEEILSEFIINAIRARHGINVLNSNAALYDATGTYGTKAYALTMAASKELSHGGDREPVLTSGPLAGTSMDDRDLLIYEKTKKVLYPVGENIHAGIDTAEVLVRGWYRSSRHYVSLLTTTSPSDYKSPSEVAVAGAIDINGRAYWAYHIAGVRKEGV